MPIQFSPVATSFFPFNGGLDQVTPPIQMRNGSLRYGTNVEIGVRGGYISTSGYERFSGQAKPSAAVYAVLPVSLIGTVAVGDMITSSVSAVTAKVVATEAGALIITAATGAFPVGGIQVGATPVGNALGPQVGGGASTPALDAAYTALAANHYRALIGPVPGSGPILGVHQYNGHVYAFRDNETGTAAVMYQDSPAGWTQVQLGRELRFTQRSGTVTISIATPAVLNWPGNSFQVGQKVTLSTTGALPTGFTAGVTYYVVVAGDNFQLSSSAGGTPVATSGTQSGVHTAYLTATEITDGSTITGQLSGATAVVKRVVLSTGTWGTSPAGSLVFETVTGLFIMGEALSMAGPTGPITVNAVLADAAIALAPGGRYEFENWNFYGQASTLRMYGCDGANRAFEFDGSTYVPISTNSPDDRPTHMEIHKNTLFLSIASSVLGSGPGSPYQFQSIFGGVELTCGEDVTSLLSLPGSAENGAMAVRTKNRTFVLYGNDSDDFNLIQYEKEAGAEPYTVQPIGGVLAFDSAGITSLATTQKFGNFQSALVSDAITPYISNKLGLSAASCIVRKKNQYRLFFTDGEAVVISYSANKLLGLTTLSYPHVVSCVSSREGASGLEEIYLGCADGYVRQAETGTSFDGEPINWIADLAFNHFGGPRQLKRFRKVALEVSGSGYCEFNLSHSLAYGSAEYAAAVESLQRADVSASNWDAFIWDRFFWDGQSLLPAEGDLTGTAENISLLFSGSSDAFQPVTLNSAILHYSPQRMLR
jgi:hypothetical protein